MSHLNPEPPEPLPEHLQYILDWFWALSRCRSYNGYGPNPLSMSEVEAWSSMTGNILIPEEVIMIQRMDSEFVHNMYERSRSSYERKTETKSDEPSPKNRKTFS